MKDIQDLISAFKILAQKLLPGLLSALLLSFPLLLQHAWAAEEWEYTTDFRDFRHIADQSTRRWSSNQLDIYPPTALIPLHHSRGPIFSGDFEEIKKDSVLFINREVVLDVEDFREISVAVGPFLGMSEMNFMKSLEIAGLTFNDSSRAPVFMPLYRYDVEEAEIEKFLQTALKSDRIIAGFTQDDRTYIPISLLHTKRAFHQDLENDYNLSAHLKSDIGNLKYVARVLAGTSLAREERFRNRYVPS